MPDNSVLFARLRPTARHQQRLKGRKYRRILQYLVSNLPKLESLEARNPTKLLPVIVEESFLPSHACPDLGAPSLVLLKQEFRKPHHLVRLAVDPGYSCCLPVVRRSFREPVAEGYNGNPRVLLLYLLPLKVVEKSLKVTAKDRLPFVGCHNGLLRPNRGSRNYQTRFWVEPFCRGVDS